MKKEIPEERSVYRVSRTQRLSDMPSRPAGTVHRRPGTAPQRPVRSPKKPHRMPPEYKLALYSLLILTIGIAVLAAGWSTMMHTGTPHPAESAASGTAVSSAASSSAAEETSSQNAADTVSEESVPVSDQRAATLRWLKENPDSSTEELLRVLENNPDAENFVFEYPQKKGTLLDCTLTPDDMYIEPDRLLPLFIQWDDRWGYSDYGGYLFGTNACGPTTLAMVLAGLTGDSGWNPRTVADFAENQGYVSPGGGSEWVLMSQGGPILGMTVEELPLSETLVRRNIQAGHPVVCIMGPGHFTTGGHYIVITGLSADGNRFLINDSNSYSRSRQEWDFDTFADEIRNLWAFSY